MKLFTITTPLLSNYSFARSENESSLVARSIADQLEKRIAFRKAIRQTTQTLQKCGVKGFKIQEAGRLNGAEIARVIGYSHSILTAERVALSFLGHMSGIASETNKYVKLIANTKARILSTRKTTPGLRAIEKYAVRCGGGYNHRYGLDYGILIKDNHIKAAGGIEKALKIIKNNKPYMTDIEVEVDTIEQFLECQRLDVRYILLDNMSPQNISECIKNNKNGAILEASGGINLDSIADIAQTGVDFISVGKLTHSSPSLDLSLHIL